TFALLSDVALLTYGGSLKRKEKLTGRFADILTWQYLATATLRRYEAEGRQAADLPLVQWSLDYAFAQMQQGFEGIFSNLEVPLLGGLLRGPLLMWLRLNPFGAMPSDRLGSKIAQALQTPGELRDRLTAGIHIPTSEQEALGRLELAFGLIHQSQVILKKIKFASQAGQLPAGKPEHLVDLAYKAKLITDEEMDLIRRTNLIRNDVIQVDDFSFEEYQHGALVGPSSSEEEEVGV
ncbi:MAG: DUF1974 domain-containing protein, partial [Coleofasciculus sp. C3-bin4]|nr:DUF1974 domain-containing protein [Coleofasciculus sp. C3-bin4]